MKRRTMFVVLTLLLLTVSLIPFWFVASQDQGEGFTSPDEYFAEHTADNVELTPLTAFAPNGEAFTENDLSEVDGGIGIEIEVTNPEGQVLGLTVYGAQSQAVVEYLNAARIFFEAIATDASLVYAPDFALGDSFLTALTEVTGLDVTEFANFERDRASEGLTLRDAISELTGDPALSDEVLSRANALLETALAEAADQGSLGDLDQQSLYSNGVEAFTIAMDEPEMPVISLPPDTERLGDEDVVILLSLIDGAVELNAGQEMTVYYIIDPPLRAITLGSVGTRHYYRVSARSVWSQAVASAGQVTNYMWRYPNGSQYGYYGVDVPGTPLPARLSMGTGSGTPTRTYDDRVVGGNGNTNTYTMYGVFTQCPSNGARDCG